MTPEEFNYVLKNMTKRELRWMGKLSRRVEGLREEYEADQKIFQRMQNFQAMMSQVDEQLITFKVGQK